MNAAFQRHADPAARRERLGHMLTAGLIGLMAMPPGMPLCRSTMAYHTLRTLQRFGIDRALRLLVPRLGQHARAMTPMSAWPLRGYR
jgi:hypothetical protein